MLTRLSRKELMLSCWLPALPSDSGVSSWKRRLVGETGCSAPGSPGGFDCASDCLCSPGEAELLISKLPPYVRFTMDDRGGEKSSCGTGMSWELYEDYNKPSAKRTIRASPGLAPTSIPGSHCHRPRVPADHPVLARLHPCLELPQPHLQHVRPCLRHSATLAHCWSPILCAMSFRC